MLTASPRTGLSILEVMIAVAILASALSIVGGTIYSMHLARTSIDEEIKVQAIAQTLVERLQGARWEDLGRDVSSYPGRNAWSWHRRATKQLAYPAVSDFPRPLRDDAPLKEHDLVNSGLLEDKSGIVDLELYLEYYQMGIMSEMSQRLRDDPKLDPRELWAEFVGDPRSGKSPIHNNISLYLPEDPLVMDLSVVDPSVILRVLVRWKSADGGIRWHELVVARRR